MKKSIHSSAGVPSESCWSQLASIQQVAGVRLEAATIVMDQAEKRDFLVFNLTQQLSGSWQFETHVYAIAILWFLVALYIFVVAINLRSVAPCKGLLCRICILLCAAGILRAVYLILDPYESKRRVNRWISRLLFISAPPILLSSFIFVFLTLLHLTKVNMSPYVLQNAKLLTIIMCTQTMALIIFEVLNELYPIILPFYMFVLSLFALWTLAVCIAFFRYGALMLQSLTAAGDPTALRYCKLRKNPSDNKNGVTTALEPPKIQITDENDCTYSYRSENASPAISDASDPSDSTEEQTDKDVNMIRDSATNPNSVNAPSLGSKQKPWKKRKKDSKQSSAAKRRRRSKSRAARLRKLIKFSFLPTTLSLFSCGWLIYESYYMFFASTINKWEWFTVVSISR